MKQLNIDKSSWKKVLFGDVVFEPKETCKDLQAEGIEHVVGLEHIDSEDLHLRKSASIVESTTFTKKFKKGDVLFGRRRAYLKKAAQASFDGICSGDITVFRAKPEKLLPELLPFLVNNDKFFDHAVKHSAGGLSPRVKFKDLADFQFLLPPKEEQAKLAELLWAMDEVVEKGKEMLIRYLLFHKSKKKDLLIPSNFGNWEFHPVHELFEKITKKNKGIITKNVLTISAQYGLINQEEYFKRQIASENLSNYFVLEQGDFAYNKSYSDGYPAGAIKVLSRYDIGVVSPLYICFKSRLDPIFNKYYDQLFNFGYLNNQILSVAKEGARNHGLLNVASTDFFNLKVPKPPLKYLMEIIPFFDGIDSSEKEIESKITNSQALMKSMINEIF